jgi:predicted AAA+ superfamily ATPase
MPRTHHRRRLHGGANIDAPWLDTAERALDLLATLREGGVLERALALASLGVLVKRALSAAESLHERLGALGYDPKDFALQKHWLESLRVSGAAYEVWTDVQNTQMRAYVWHDIGLAAVVQGEKIYYWMGAPDCETRLAAALRDTNWRATDQLRLYALDEDMLEIQLVPLPPLDDLAGPTALEELVLRVGEARGSTVLVRGPSGVGKTTVARRLAARAMGPGARMLQIPSEILGVLEASQLREIVSILQPDVLVIDDIDFGEDEPDLLTRLEAVRSARTFVVITQMTAPGEVAEGIPEPGSLYRPGMRPGRIDEIVTVKAPDEEGRRLILAHYLGTEPPSLAVTATAGLTGAYLKELARRIRARGTDHLEEEIAALLAQAPVRREARPGRSAFLPAEA